MTREGKRRGREAQRYWDGLGYSREPLSADRGMIAVRVPSDSEPCYFCTVCCKYSSPLPCAEHYLKPVGDILGLDV